MKRVIFILLVTLVGIISSFVDAYYGLLLYTWYSFASPLELTYGALSGTRLSLVVAAIVIATTLQQRKQIVSHHILCLLMGLFLFTAFASLAISMQFSLGYVFGELELLAKILLMASLAPILIDSVKRLRYFIVTIALSIGLLGFYYGVFGLLAGSTSISGPGRIGDNNGYSVLLVANISLLAFSIRYLPQLRTRLQEIAVTNLLVLGNVIAAILTFSRGGFMALSFVSVLLLLNVQSLWTRLLTWLIVLPTLFLIGWNIFSTNPNNIPISFDESGEGSIIQQTLNQYTERVKTLREQPEELSSASSRLHFWQIALEMTKNHPVFGVGLRRFPMEYNKYDWSNGKFGKNRAVHNTILSVLSETGVSGFLIFSFIIFFCIHSQSKAKGNARANLNESDSQEILDYVKMIRISMLGFFIGSFFVNCLYQELLWALVSISIALEKVSGAKQ